MQILNILPFREAVLAAVAIASFFTILLGLVMFKWRRAGSKLGRNAQKHRATQVEGQLKLDRDGERLHEEISSLTAKLASTLDRLDVAIGRCIDLLEKLPDEESAKGELRIVHSPEPKPDTMKKRIEKLKVSGLAEEEIAKTLSLSREQLKLYMHSGKGEREEMILQ